MHKISTLADNSTDCYSWARMKKTSGSFKAKTYSPCHLPKKKASWHPVKLAGNINLSNNKKTGLK